MKDIMKALDVFYEEPKQMVTGQQSVTYHNGYALENPNRKQAREPYTEEELIAIYDKDIEVAIKRWGVGYYSKQAENVKLNNMKAWEEGKVVHVTTNEYHSNGMDWVDTYYSDGTMITTCYGWTD